MVAAQESTIIVCFSSAPALQFGSWLQDILGDGLEDKTLALRFIVPCGLFMAAANVAAYAHAMLYRHQEEAVMRPETMEEILHSQFSAECSSRIKLERGWTLLGGVFFGFSCLLGLVCHSYYSITSLKLNTKKMRELSKALLLSMSCQITTFFLTLTLPLIVLMAKYGDEDIYKY
ncbi:unnamed protein product, partial [Mesorhabditis spiculigera]